MTYRLLADLVLISHLAFVLFALFGGLLALKQRRVAWFHLPAAAWAALIEFTGWTCPLTPLENLLRQKGGTAGYRTGFVEHYILPVLYPEAMTVNVQIVLGVLVIVVNIAIYAWVFRRSRSANTRL